MNRLYTLRALSRVNAMQTTTDSASVHVSPSLIFILPFLVAGHAWQFYNCWSLLTAAIRSSFLFEWQAATAGVLFGVIGSGNILTTFWTLWKKSQRQQAHVKRE